MEPLRAVATQDGMFSYVSLEARVRKDQPLFIVRRTENGVPETLAQRFEGLYAKTGVA